MVLNLQNLYITILNLFSGRIFPYQLFHTNSTKNLTSSTMSQQDTQSTFPPNDTQASTQQNQIPSRKSSSNGDLSHRGRQRGSQGYSGEDCTALVEIVKGILPLGSNDWDRVHELYTNYATQNGRLARDCEPLKSKFKSLVVSKKPTGDPTCPVWIREAKRANFMIKERACNLAIVDEDKEGSNDER